MSAREHLRDGVEDRDLVPQSPGSGAAGRGVGPPVPDWPADGRGAWNAGGIMPSALLSLSLESQIQNC